MSLLKKDSAWFDAVEGRGALPFSFVGQLASVFESVMNPKCASNVVSLVCHTAFRECARVATLRDVWAPSLLCRSKCKQHLKTWKSCVAELENDPETKRNFDDAMKNLVLSSKSSIASLVFVFLALSNENKLLSIVPCCPIYFTCRPGEDREGRSTTACGRRYKSCCMHAQRVQTFLLELVEYLTRSPRLSTNFTLCRCISSHGHRIFAISSFGMRFSWRRP